MLLGGAIMCFLAAATMCRAAEEQATSTEDFIETIGVNTHLGYGDTVYHRYEDIIKPRLLELGVRHIRDGTFSETVADRYLELGRAGIRVLFITNPKRVVAQAKRISPALFAVEGENEPDNHYKNWVERIRADQQALYAAVKGDADLGQLPVLVSSLANIRDNPAKLGDLSEHMDFGNMHPYAAAEAPSRHWGWGIGMAKAISEARKVSGTKRIIATECGYHNRLDQQEGHPGTTESAAAKFMPRMAAVYFNAGIARSYFYEFADEKPDANFRDKEQHFGLIRVDGSVKPSFTAMKNLISVLKDPGPRFQAGKLDFALTGETNNVHHTLLQKRDGRFWLLLWQEAVSYDVKTKRDVAVPDVAVAVELPRGMASARVYRPNRGTDVVSEHAAGKTLKLSVPDEVLIAEIAVQ